MENKLHTGLWFQCESCNKPNFSTFGKLSKLIDKNIIQSISCKGCGQIFDRSNLVEKIESDYVGIGIAFICPDCGNKNIKLCDTENRSLNEKMTAKFALLETTQCRSCASEFEIETIFDESSESYRNILIKKN